MSTDNYKINNTFHIQNEEDLHKKIVSFIRKRFPNSIIIASLGELQKTVGVRCKAKAFGYEKGSPDLIIICGGRNLAIEFKSPLGKGCLSNEQKLVLERYRENQFHTLVSNDYDEILEKILTYFNHTDYR